MWQLATVLVLPHALMVGITYLWVALCLHANRRALVHRRSGARALGSSTSAMVHIVHYDVSVHLCVSSEPLGLGIYVSWASPWTI